ncbi:MAG: beta-lactamase family protein [Dethiosulfatibacter sp.]|nr:beta-lactamase family protein [Dethiosulfatibacter sp.]
MNSSTKVIVSILITLVLFVGCGEVAMTDEIDDSTKEEIIAFQQRADEFLSKRNFNGSVLVVKEGIVYFGEGYGMADVENDLPNERETIYLIGSLTKSFTSMAIMQLHESKKLNVNDPIDKYFPKYPNTSKITIHHLLTHTSGIDPNPIDFSAFSELFDLNNNIIDKSVITEILEVAAEKPLLFDPGTKFDYSNNGYMLLGAIIEEVSGLSFGEYIDEYICKPLEMTSTGYNTSGVPLEEQAIDASRSYSSNVNPVITYAGGGMHSTVDDLYRWDDAIRNNLLISKKSTDKMLTPFIDSYAYGWRISNKNEYIHTGNINGYRSLFIANTEKDYTVIILSNYPSTAEVNRIAQILISYIEEL